MDASDVAVSLLPPRSVTWLISSFGETVFSSKQFSQTCFFLPSFVAACFLKGPLCRRLVVYALYAKDIFAVFLVLQLSPIFLICIQVHGRQDVFLLFF